MIVIIIVLIFGLTVNKDNSQNIEEDIIGINDNINNLDAIDYNINNSGNHPNMYLNASEIDAIKEKVKNGQEPWKSAYYKMISDADKTLNEDIVSVTYQGDKGNDYYSDIPYCGWKKVDGKDPDCRDGKINPEADREDYSASIKIGKSVRDLGLAYAFTGDKKYADKAIGFINAWTINPDTKMNPKFTNSQSRLEISVTIPGMFYGADLIWNYPGWNPSNKEKFRDWTRKMVNGAKTWSRDNNWEGWRLVFISSASIITEDSKDLNYTFEKWKEVIPIQIGDDGKMVQELHRTKSLFYSVFGINALIQTAEIARHNGVDLYNYKTSDGRGLELALDYYAPYVINHKEWELQQIATYKGEGAAAYELAYSFIEPKTTYKRVIEKWRRPMYENRNIGPVTLTHVTIG